MKNRLLCLWILCIFIATSFSGCGSSTEVKSIIVNEATHTVFYAPFYVAIEKGYFKEEGLKVNLISTSGSDKVMASIKSDDCDIAVMGPENSIYAYHEGAEDYIIDFAQLTQRAGDFLVTRDLNENYSWDNIKGKTLICNRTDALGKMVLEYILKKHGIDPKEDVNMITDIGFGSTAQSFTSGQGDYTIEFEPTATALEKGGAGKIAVSLGQESGKVPYTVFAAKKIYISKHPQIIQKFTDALQKGLDYVAAHTPEEVAKVIKPQFSETDKEDLVKILKSYYAQDTWKDNLILEKGSFSLLEDILIDAGQYQSDVPYEAVVMTAYARKSSTK